MNDLIEKTDKRYEETDFFINLAHEFKTPINMILATEKLLEIDIKSNIGLDNYDDIEKRMDVINKNCNRLLKLINNNIDIVKIKSGFLTLDLKNVDIVYVIEDLVASVVGYAEAKNISLIFDTDIEEKVIVCDPYKLERIVLNLLSNALKFTKQNGSVYVDIKQREGKVDIIVRDTGIGICREKQENIFKRYFQIENSNNLNGSGIGLSLVKSLVDMHDGDITLESESGKGSSFKVTLNDKKLTYTEKVFPYDLDYIKDDYKVKLELAEI